MLSQYVRKDDYFNAKQQKPEVFRKKGTDSGTGVFL